MKPSGSNRRGQAVVFLLMALTGLVFLLLWNVDIGRIIAGKNRAQQAGDSAALAAARWQGSTLNLIGELNIFHAAALADGNLAACDAITNLQARLCYTGPMAGFYAAQIAAKNNRSPSEPEFTEVLQEHRLEVMNNYKDMDIPEPFADAWSIVYPELLSAVCGEGIAAGPENMKEFAEPVDAHYLLNPGFYEAVSSGYWCWFFYAANRMELLEGYGGYGSWPPLPSAGENTSRNNPYDCPVFGLGVARQEFVLFDFVDRTGFQNNTKDYPQPNYASTNLNTTAGWFVYDTRRWPANGWTAMKNPGSADGLPVYGPPKLEYDYEGADAAVRIYSKVTRFTPGPNGATQTDTLTWSAAAKPFGYLDEGGEAVRPDSLGLVLPAFREVRLIPMDASSAPETSMLNPAWRTHRKEHLPDYMKYGPSKCDGNCYYCRALILWENPAYRKSGVDWLRDNSWKCTLPGTGGRAGGGSRRGH